jgi:pyruvate,water dikinase
LGVFPAHTVDWKHTQKPRINFFIEMSDRRSLRKEYPMQPFTLSLSHPQADLETVGGKGMSLAKLALAGLPVPDGFHVTTQAYRHFVTAHDLQPAIHRALAGADASPAALEAASATITQCFVEAEIPGDLADAIVAAYADLPGENPPVAVRSSATAEDLPGASFAGQQETYLNIRGAEAVLEATRRCWASLWTARAISYRVRQNISPDAVTLAVVVQLLIPADAAGILFTANPLNGKRDERVINAAWGLGEAIVGGLVTPDCIIVEKGTAKILSRETAEKQVMTVRNVTGTHEQPVPDALKNAAVLTDTQATQLAAYGTRIEQLYGMPMDIEWALAGDRFAILQARPITALPEEPIAWTPPKPKGIYMRGSVVDLMPDPLSPLFASLGIPALMKQMITVGKHFTHATPALPDDYFLTINSYAYMGANFPPSAWWWVITSMFTSYPRMLREMLPYWREQVLPGYRTLAARLQQKSAGQLSSGELWQSVQEVNDAAMNYVCTLMFATMGASAGAEGLLSKLYEKFAQAGDPPVTTLLMGWDNIPVRAEKSLYDLATWCREQPDLADYLLETPAKGLAQALKSSLPPANISPEAWQAFQNRFAQHLEQFGYILFQLDFVEPLPRDHPEPMLENIKMYLRGVGANPHERQQASQEKRIRSAETMLQRLKGVKLWAFRKALRWAQSLAEVREDALAEIGVGYPVLQDLLHELGQRFVTGGAILEPGDIFWLEKGEIETAISAMKGRQVLSDFSKVVEKRKLFWKKAKNSTPPPMIPPMKKYMGIDISLWLPETEGDPNSSSLKGVAASAGKITAAARILRGPQDFDQMQPGEILVAPITTPAWTPLFAMASAVVTDIGGPLSHGSIVAREYGIPAVMGTGVATKRIRNGQMITVDGSSGIVTIGEQD